MFPNVIFKIKTFKIKASCKFLVYKILKIAILSKMNINSLSIYLHNWLQAKLYVYATKNYRWFFLFISLKYFKMFLKSFSERSIRFNRTIASGSCPLNWQLTMRLTGHESGLSHIEHWHNASVFELVSNTTKFIAISTPKPIFFQIFIILPTN